MSMCRLFHTNGFTFQLLDKSLLSLFNFKASIDTFQKFFERAKMVLLLIWFGYDNIYK